MFTIKLKSRTIELPDLNEDCNFMLQSCNIENSSKYQNVILSTLSFIEWDLINLGTLNDHDLIDWQIYSSNDLSEEIIQQYMNRIVFSNYLSFIERKYKIIPDSHISRIEFLSSTDLNNQLVLKNAAQSKPDFYYTKQFLSTFKFTVDTMNLNICKKYINDPRLVSEFVLYFPPDILEHYVKTLSFNADDLKKIADTFSGLERNKIWNIIFQHQQLSFSFISSKTWTYNIWITILVHQKISNEELLFLAKIPAGKTIMQLACKFKELHEDFISENWSILDIDLITQHQNLSYDFVRTNIHRIKIESLTMNQKIKFKIVEVPNDDEILDIPNKYIIINTPAEKNNILFID